MFRWLHYVAIYVCSNLNLDKAIQVMDLRTLQIVHTYEFPHEAPSEANNCALWFDGDRVVFISGVEEVDHLDAHANASGTFYSLELTLPLNPYKPVGTYE
jgi:hypothetical protein